MVRARNSRPCCRVLIVEDDPFARRALATLLTLQGHQVTSTASAQEAVELLCEKRGAEFTHVLVDLALPSGDAAEGTAVLAHLRETRHPAHVAVITATTDQGLISRAMALGPERFYQKPLEIDRLIDWLRQTDPEEGKAGA